MRALFLIYIAFVYFAVLNVMTANFCQTAFESAKSDQETILRGAVSQKVAYGHLLARVFKVVDNAGAGHITLRDLEEHWQDDSVQALFTSLDLCPKDAWA